MTPGAYPETAAGRNRWIRALRPERRDRDPGSAYGAFLEEEPDGRGGVARVATLLLTNRECPWTCLMCDLWRDTLTRPVAPGAIREQVCRGLDSLPPATRVKLYNAGSFFDPAAVPRADLPEIAALLSPYDVTTVECHPALVGAVAVDFARRLPGRLELALGLETVHADVLPRLNKGMTVESFVAAARFARDADLLLRVFVLVGLPFVTRDEALDAARRSVDLALDVGAGVVSLIPLRSGNGALEVLEARGELQKPTLGMLEAAHAHALAVAGPRGAIALADTWDLDRLSACAACAPGRRSRLQAANLTQRTPPPVDCDVCGGVAA